MADETGYLETLALEMDKQRPDLMPLVEQTLDSISDAMLVEFEKPENGGTVQQRIISTQVTIITALLQALIVSLPKHMRTITATLVTTFALDLAVMIDADDDGCLDMILAEARERRGGIS